MEDYIEEVGYAQISYLLTTCPISDGAFRAYALILGLAQQKQKVQCGMKKLAILRGVARRTLIRHMNELASFGLIKRQRRQGTSTVITLTGLEKGW